ncbi:MAG: hypothetical protein HY791_31530 [Deltaproteobacteria bacterium]|nr:hypothetical protein [Deltaproteobacteria bacterium]
MLRQPFPVPLLALFSGACSAPSFYPDDFACQTKTNCASTARDAGPRRDASLPPPDAGPADVSSAPRDSGQPDVPSAPGDSGPPDAGASDATPSECPDPNDPNIEYDPANCRGIEALECSAGKIEFSSPCGCGCRRISAGELLVSLDAADFVDGSTWLNRGTLGGAFSAVGHPSVTSFLGVRGVQFDGERDAFVGPATTSTLEGASDRSVEVWVANSSFVSEETTVSWSKRNGGPNTNFTFNFGDSPGLGAAGHWANDMGWLPLPEAGRWHHLVYSYDGQRTVLYADGVANSQLVVTLATSGGYPINVAAQRAESGDLTFVNSFTDEFIGGSLVIGAIRIHSGALSESDVVDLFEADKARFGI